MRREEVTYFCDSSNCDQQITATGKSLSDLKGWSHNADYEVCGKHRFDLCPLHTAVLKEAKTTYMTIVNGLAGKERTDD